MIKVNEYYEGKIKSLGNSLKDERFTVGIMEEGEYKFGTDTVEIMEIVFGEMDAILPGGVKKTYKKGDSFQVDKDVEFIVIIREPVTYLCLYK
ncbi:MAG: pyrimidine/purine nucleoside phosphorylase [Candidatus Aminicenantes bacterium]|nr:pyrimidine/purine nucleoside phosphorylase [Candidatus Aminicenantes bacterium]